MKKLLIITLVALGSILTGCSSRVYSDGYGGYGPSYGGYYGPAYGYRPYYARPRVYVTPPPRVYRHRHYNNRRNDIYRRNNSYRRNDSFRNHNSFRAKPNPGNRGGGPRSRGPR
ncbi:hypothetical protein [Siphonobacter sp.]|uniref:hypothetical protein n=1 Tax=Siphonobacter sp. TaxID=1869184 RepID=UPI003B3BE152